MVANSLVLSNYKYSLCSCCLICMCACLFVWVCKASVWQQGNFILTRQPRLAWHLGLLSPSSKGQDDKQELLRSTVNRLCVYFTGWSSCLFTDFSPLGNPPKEFPCINCRNPSFWGEKYPQRMLCLTVSGLGSRLQTENQQKLWTLHFFFYCVPKPGYSVSRFMLGFQSP